MAAKQSSQMEGKIIKGCFLGLGLALLIIVTHPFHPTTGLIPELSGFLTAVPIWIAVLIRPALTPVGEGIALLVYFTVVGALLGAAFFRRKLWGWMLVIALSIHHYLMNERVGRPLGEILQVFLNYFNR